MIAMRMKLWVVRNNSILFNIYFKLLILHQALSAQNIWIHLYQLIFSYFFYVTVQYFFVLTFTSQDGFQKWGGLIYCFSCFKFCLLHNLTSAVIMKLIISTLNVQDALSILKSITENKLIVKLQWRLQANHENII